MVDFDILWQYMPRILNGALLTIQIAVASLLLAVLVGLVGALMRLSKSPILAGLATTYSTVVRGVPDLIWMLMVYYSAQLGINAITDALGWRSFEISPFFAGVFTLSFIFGAYFTETFRGAILAVPYGQIEAAYAYGLSPFQVLSRVTFPLMMRYALPGVRNNWLVLTKATALVSIIGLDDMTRVAQQAGSSTHYSFAFNMVSACLYLLITFVSLKVFVYLDKRYQRGVRQGVAHE